MAKRPRWTVKRENFSVAVAKGASYTQAYRDAGYAWRTLSEQTLWNNASRLAGTSEVRSRVAALQAAAASKGGRTLNEIVAELDAAYEVAKRQENAAAMTGAAVAKAKLLGFFVDRQETKVSTDELQKPEVGKLQEAAKRLEKDNGPEQANLTVVG